MWEVRAQFSRPNKENAGGELEWSSVLVETAEEAEAWWDCRTQGRSTQPSTHTMFDPAGEVVRVQFN